MMVSGLAERREAIEVRWLPTACVISWRRERTGSLDLRDCIRDSFSTW